MKRHTNIVSVEMEKGTGSIRIESTRWLVFKSVIIAFLAVTLIRYSNTFIVVEGEVDQSRIIKIALAGAVLVLLAIIKLDLSECIAQIVRIILSIAAIFTTVIMSDEIINNEIASATIEAPLNTFSKLPVCIMVSFSAVVIFFMLIYAITNRIAIAAIATEITSLILALLIVLVSDFRGIPLMASDLMSAKVAVNVAGNYTYIPTFLEFDCLLVLAVQCFAFTQVRGKKDVKNPKIRLAIFGMALIVASLFARNIVMSDFLSEKGIEIDGWKPSNSYMTYGAISTFLRSVKYTKVEKPEDYSLIWLAEINSRYESDTVAEKEAGELPNVIVVVNEAFSELQVLGKIETNADYMPVIHSLQENCVKGYYYASVCGGGTANTEFEVLTAGTMGFLGGGVAFEIYIRNNLPALPAIMKSLGYSSCKALHPCSAENYNRIEAYPCLGFDEFVALEDIEGDYDKKKLRGWVSDEATYDYIIDEYEKEDREKPFFIYDLTMQNHSPYDTNARFKQAIRIKGDTVDSEVEEYLNLIAVSDKALGELIEYFEQEEKPTVILFMGDHQPRITEEFLGLVTNGASDNWGEEEWMVRYLTPFMIWANYDIEEKEIEFTSANYLQSILTNAAGLPQTAYQKYLTDLQKKIPWINGIGYMGDNGVFYLIDDKDSPYYEEVEKYRIIQYNFLFDKKHRMNEFFELQR